MKSVSGVLIGGGNVCCVPDQNPSPNLRLVASAPSDDANAAVFTIKDVADACGLPQPVIAQLVPRTWTDAGWMYTKKQLEMAVDVAHAFRARYADARGMHTDQTAREGRAPGIQLVEP